MKLFSSKKANGEATEETIYPIFAMVIAFVVIMLQLLFMIHGLRDNTIFDKAFLERDIANTIDSLYASPANIIVDYDKNTSWFSFKFDKNSVNVYGKIDMLNPDNVVYYFTPDKKTAYSTMELKAVFKNDEASKENLDKSVDIRFAKIDGKFKINEKESLKPNMDELDCYEIQNARHYSEYATKSFNDISEIDDAIATKNAKNDNKELFVWYYPGSYSDTNKNTIKVFISSDINLEKNRRLACLILNQLLDKLEKIIDENDLKEINGVAIIPTDSWQMLNQEKYLSVLLEIGNKKILDDKKLWPNQDATINDNIEDTILEAIRDGVNSYG